MKAMKSIMRFFSIAALAAAVATMVGCAKDGNNIADGLTFTTTVQLPTGGSKAIDRFGHKTFVVGDKIKLTVNGTVKVLSEPLTAANISADGKAAAFTFNFASAPTLTVGTLVKYEYPGFSLLNPYNIETQDYGTLQTLSTQADYSVCETEITTEGQLPSNIHLTNMFAILKLVIKNSVGTNITSGIDILNVSIDHQYINNGYNYFAPEQDVNIAVESHAGSFEDTLYVVVPSVNNGGQIVFTTSDYNDYYECTRTKNVPLPNDMSLQAGHMYPVELTMSEATVTWEAGIIKCTAGVGNGGIDAHNYEYTGASLGGITLYTREGATWTGGNINGMGGQIYFTSEYGNIKQIEMRGFTMTGGVLHDRWTQTDETTFTWTQDPLLESSNRVYLVNGNSLCLTAGDGAQIVFTVE